MFDNTQIKLKIEITEWISTMKNTLLSFVGPITKTYIKGKTLFYEKGRVMCKTAVTTWSDVKNRAHSERMN